MLSARIEPGSIMSALDPCTFDLDDVSGETFREFSE
jgi:hypothetical protein